MSLKLIVFSPTGGTKAVADLLASNFDVDPSHIDLCDAGADFSSCEITSNDEAIIAMPSFGGRAPQVAIERLAEISGNGAACTLACVYGNRAYEDTLIEMADAAKAAGFKVVAAVSAVAQHSIMEQFACGRPDASDAARLREFSLKVVGKREPLQVELPGHRPYKKVGGARLVPKVTKACVKCGKCATACPVRAISAYDFTADSQTCTSCMRCMCDCPAHARKVNGLMVKIASAAIAKECNVRKEAELFL